jgi:hypothetical protein
VLFATVTAVVYTTHEMSSSIGSLIMYAVFGPSVYTDWGLRPTTPTAIDFVHMRLHTSDLTQYASAYVFSK